MNTFRALLLLVVSIATVLDAQSTPEWVRADRVVLYSPHFDLVPEPYGGVSCPPQPLRLYGFETTSRDTTTVLLVRLLLPIDPRSGPPPIVFPNEAVRLARRWVDDRFVDLLDSPAWSGTTDSLGRARLRVPAGIYELLIRGGRPIGRGIIRIRSGHQDSLHAYIRPPALC